MVAGYGDTVVPVQDEIDVAQPVQAHRREVLSPMERLVYALPSHPRARAKGHEGTIEFTTTSHAPDDLLQIDDPYSPAQPVERPEGSLRFIERGRHVLRRGSPAQTSR